MTWFVDSIRDRVLWMFGFVPETTSRSGDQQAPYSNEYTYDYLQDFGFRYNQSTGYDPGSHQDFLKLLHEPLSEIVTGADNDAAPETVEDVLTALVEERIRVESANEYYGEALRQIAEESDADAETVQQVLGAFVGWMNLFTETVSRTHGVDRETAMRTAYALIPYMARARLPSASDDPAERLEVADRVGRSEDESGRTFVPSFRVAANFIAGLIVLAIAVGGAADFITVSPATLTLVAAAVSLLGGSLLSAPKDQSPSFENGAETA